MARGLGCRRRLEDDADEWVARAGAPDLGGLPVDSVSAMVTLLGDDELERSPVVANRAMNRERALAGVNSYARELGRVQFP